MKHKRLWISTVGLASFTCVFVGEFPYSLIPFAFFIYLSIPGPDRDEKLAERRAASRALRRSTTVKKQPHPLRPIHILDPVEDRAGTESIASAASEMVAEAEVVVAKAQAEFVAEGFVGEELVAEEETDEPAPHEPPRVLERTAA
jgi:hypothetical protein